MWPDVTIMIIIISQKFPKYSPHIPNKSPNYHQHSPTTTFPNISNIPMTDPLWCQFPTVFLNHPAFTFPGTEAINAAPKLEDKCSCTWGNHGNPHGLRCWSWSPPSRKFRESLWWFSLAMENDHLNEVNHHKSINGPVSMRKKKMVKSSIPRSYI